ncbi:hypothetical protein AVEN_271446-1 [Araneus ventricosus]|uniref:Uncharacterized protein n=1 Tax=Araneus ventricosus TaxID=182803 RepID=A0A4Y2R3G6_ARAVE|nr:hypothetical protein AVEN_271446-1 [Araneus ventricosus]
MRSQKDHRYIKIRVADDYKLSATSDEGNQLKRLQLRSGKTAVISATTEACALPMRGGFTLLAFSLSVWVLIWSGGNEEGTPIYI